MPLPFPAERSIHLMIRRALAPAGLWSTPHWVRRWHRILAGLPGSAALARAAEIPQSVGWGRMPETLAWQDWLDEHPDKLQTMPLLRMSLAHFALTHHDALLAAAPLNAIFEAEADALWHAAEPSLIELGWRFLPLGEGRTLSLAERWVDPSQGPALVWPERDWAIGRSLRSIAPQGSAQAMLAWRQAFNSVQMIWHSHEINQNREARGLLTVNGIQVDQPLKPSPALSRHSTDWLIQGDSAVAHSLGGTIDSFSFAQALQTLESEGRSAKGLKQNWVREIDDLRGFAESGDTAGWLNAWESLAALLRHTAQLGRLTLYLLGSEHILIVRPQTTRQGTDWLQRVRCALFCRDDSFGLWAEEPRQ